MTNYSKKSSVKAIVAAIVAVFALTLIMPALASAQVPASNESNGDAPASAPASNPSNGDSAAPVAPAPAPASNGSNGDASSGAPASNPSNGTPSSAPASNPSTGEVAAPAANPSNGGSSTGPGIVPASNPSNGSTGPGIVPPAANPSNGGSSTGAGSAPASNPSNGSVTSGSAPAANPSNGSATASTPVTPSNPPVSGGGNGNGSLPLGNGPIVVNAASGVGSVNQNPSQNVVPASCSLIGAQIIIGAANNSTDVANLQKFLNQFEGAKLTVNGAYDASTIEAVKSFQAKYASEILAPWGISTPTGNVFITTRVKIDEISCGKSIGLTADERAIISSFKSQNENGAVIGTPSTGGTPSTTPIVGSENSGQTVAKKSFFQNTASVILAVPKAVGRFFKKLF